MLFLFLFSLTASLAITLPILSTPVTMGIWLLAFSVMAASVVSFMSTSWFGLILFIIYVGGMLVMFSYFSAISPNQQMNLAPSALIALLSSTCLASLVFSSLTTQEFSLVPYPSAQPSLSLLFSHMNVPILLFLVLLLLLAMILVVKLAQRSEGPLRPFK